MNNKYLTASTVTLFDAEIHPPPLRGQAFKALLADKPKTTHKHKETTTEATDATPE